MGIKMQSSRHINMHIFYRVCVPRDFFITLSRKSVWAAIYSWTLLKNLNDCMEMFKVQVDGTLFGGQIKYSLKSFTKM